MSDENARHGDAGTPEVPPAGSGGERSVPAASLPPKPSAPPTSATPIVPPSEPKAGDNTDGAGTAGAAALVSANAARLSRWVRRQGRPRIGAAAVVLVVVGLLTWLLAATLGSPKPSEAAGPPAASSAPASRGPLPLADISPLDFRLGDCFKDFDPDAQQSTIVDCATGHSAQLVAVEQYAAPDAYPGRDELKQRARDACKAATLADKAGDYDLSYKLAYPSSSSWEKGDRRVDCYIIAKTGNAITESLLP